MTFGIDSHRPLTLGEKGAGLAVLTLTLPHVALATRTYAAGLSAMRWGFKFGVPYAFGAGFDWNRSIQPDLDFLGPGGGGPGHSLTSTTPPSVEATGASLAQRGKTEGPARASKRGSRPRRYALPIDSSKAFGKHNPCDKGYHPRKIKGRWYCVRK